MVTPFEAADRAFDASSRLLPLCDADLDSLPSLALVAAGVAVSSCSNPASDTALTSFRRRKRSYRASSSSSSGNSFEAPITHRTGQSSRSPPLSNFLSFNIVKSVFKMAELALKISSRNPTDALGRNPSVTRLYSSFSRAQSDSGPKISSGVVNLVNSRWKKPPPSETRSPNRLATILFAVPGGPNSSKCSLASIASTTSRDSSSLSTRSRPTNPMAALS